MILEGAGVCPFIKIGDAVETGISSSRSRGMVTDLVCDKNTSAACRAFKAVAVIVFREGSRAYGDMSPAVLDQTKSSVDCDTCPILAKDPDHKWSKSKSVSEIVREAEERGTDVQVVREGAVEQEQIAVLVRLGYSEKEAKSIIDTSAQEQEVEHPKQGNRNRFELIDMSK